MKGGHKFQLSAGMLVSSPYGLAYTDNVQDAINQLANPCYENYDNHVGVADNFFYTDVGGSGSADLDAANHELDLSSGINVANSYARWGTKKKYGLSAKPTLINLILNNIQNGIGAGSDMIVVGLIRGAPTNVTPSYAVGFYKDYLGSNDWWCITNSGGADQTLTSIPAPANGDLLTVVATQSVVQFFKNGVLIATHTTNIPDLTAFPNILGGGVYGNSLTTAVKVSIDYVGIKIFQ